MNRFSVLPHPLRIADLHDGTSNTIVTTITVGGLPQGVAITPDGAFVYVANSFSNSVSVVDTASNRVITAVVGVGETPSDIAIGFVR